MDSLAWNYGDLFDAIGARVPERTALVHESTSRSWGEIDKRTNRLARAWLETAGVSFGDKVAFLARNGPAYVEGAIAAFKARLVHVNVNFRYVADELLHVIDNSDAAIVVYDSEFAERLHRIRKQLPKVRLFVEAGGASLNLDGAVSYEKLAGEGRAEPLGLARSEDDLMFLYTGGTTGLPKGVMWRQGDRLSVLSRAEAGLGASEFLAGMLERPATRLLPACPLMHSTGFSSAMTALVGGGCVVTMEGRFAAERLWELADEHEVTSVAIVGDAFAVPLLRALEENPDRWKLESLRQIVSAGVMWSDTTKAGISQHLPNVTLVDTFGSSEGSGLGRSVWGKQSRARTGEFRMGESCRVFTEDHKEVVPGSGVPGLIAKSGPIPLGYYKDPDKTRRTFPTIDGVRYSIPGDWCLVNDDGTLMLLGRGNTCINTGGEKVYPEEVEEVLKRHPSVEDALVVGVPDERWGQRIVAVVAGLESSSEEDLQSFVRESLADYKAPKHIIFQAALKRAENGKPDLSWAREIASAAVEEKGAIQ